MDHTDLIIIVGAVLGGFVQGLSGFAFGLVAMAMWAWSLDPHLAGPLVVFGGLFGQLISIRTIRGSFQANRAAPFIVGGLVGVPLGTALLTVINPLTFKIFVGVVLVGWCSLMLRARTFPKVTAGGKSADGAAGFVGGVMGGLGGLCGPAPTLWCTLRGWARDEQRAVFQPFNLSMQVMTMVTYVWGGLITLDTLKQFAIVAVALLIPNFIGTKVYAGLSDEKFRKVILVLLAVSGGVILITAAPQIAAAYL